MKSHIEPYKVTLTSKNKSIQFHFPIFESVKYDDFEKKLFVSINMLCDETIKNDELEYEYIRKYN